MNISATTRECVILEPVAIPMKADLGQHQRIGRRHRTAAERFTFKRIPVHSAKTDHEPKTGW